MGYQPTPADVAWTRRHLNMLKEGAIWGYPGIFCFFRVSHADRSLTLVDALDLKDPHVIENLATLEAVLTACDYRLIRPAPERGH